MSRDLTTAFKTAITDTVVRPLWLVTAVFDSETLRFWNGTTTLSFGGDDYIGAGNLLNISEVVETQKTEARGIKIELTGIPTDLISVALGEDYQDRVITIDLALVDATGDIILDPYRYFSGKADVMTIEESAETAIIIMTAESDLIILKRVNERRRTSEDQKLTYTGDTFFDSVTALQSKDIVWGAGTQQ